MSRVGGRGYPPDDYDERDRDRDYSGGPRRRPVYDEVDVDIRNTRRAPDFLREDYGRVNNAELVVRGNRRLQSPESDSPPPPSRRRPKERLPPIEREEIDIDIRREREPERRRPPRREFEEEEVVVRRRQIPDDPPPPRERDPPPREEIDIDIRREERQGQRQRPREEEIEVDIRREERRPRPRPPRELEREEEPPRQRRREKPVEEIDIDIRREGSERPRRPRPWEEEIDINIKREDPRERVKETIIYREPSPPRHVAREREEFIYRRREPERPPVIEKEEIIVRRIRSPSPESSPSPPPPAPPSLEPVTRPPIVQEVITHYRNIDHGSCPSIDYFEIVADHHRDGTCTKESLILPITSSTTKTARRTTRDRNPQTVSSFNIFTIQIHSHSSLATNAAALTPKISASSTSQPPAHAPAPQNQHACPLRPVPHPHHASSAPRHRALSSARKSTST